MRSVPVGLTGSLTTGTISTAKSFSKVAMGKYSNWRQRVIINYLKQYLYIFIQAPMTFCRVKLFSLCCY